MISLKLRSTYRRSFPLGRLPQSLRSGDGDCGTVSGLMNSLNEAFVTNLP